MVTCLEKISRRRRIGPATFTFTSNLPARSTAGSIKSWPITPAPMTMMDYQAFDAIDLRQKLRHDGRLDVGRNTGAACAEQGVHFVEKHDHRMSVIGPFLYLREHFARRRSDSPTYLFSSSGPSHEGK